MGKTSSKVKDRYNMKAYDEIKIRVPKGEKERIKTFADKADKSVNAFITEAVNEKIAREGESDE